MHRNRLASFTGLVLCGLGTAQTWQGVGAPPPRALHALADDLSRGRTVLFGGYLMGSATWEFDGANWRSVTTTNAPPARIEHALAHDSARGRIVLYGGEAYPNFLADTWEFDGSNWTQVTTTGSPGGRSAHALAFDVARSRTVMFGGWNGTPALVAETWEYDGTNWIRRNTPSSPPARWDHAMAYQWGQGRTVLFGGFDMTLTGFVDTWEYDGNTWIQVATPTTPPPRWDVALAHDFARSRTVLFGSGTDTWEYDGLTWTQTTTPAAPPAVTGHAMAYHAGSGRTVLFGGATSTEVLGDTWTYDGLNWTRARIEPSARLGASLTHDPVRNRTILFGGVICPPPGWGCPGTCPIPFTDDTWEFDGTAWRQVTTTVAPAPRSAAGLVHDTRRGRSVLFGGNWNRTYGGAPDTWEYDGAQWTQMNTAASPTPRVGHGMTFDALRGCVVLFGGSGWGAPLADTWEYDGTNWTQVPTAAAPPGRQGHGLAWSTARNRTVLFGGAGPGLLADTWEYDGTTWTQLATPIAPQARTGHVMTCDPARGRIVLTGGQSWFPAFTYHTDTWELSGNVWTLTGSVSPVLSGAAITADPARGRVLLWSIGLSELVEPALPTWTRYGRGCPGSAGTPSLDAPVNATPALGTAFPLQFTTLPGPSGALFLSFGLGIARWNGRALPADLGPFGLAGCQLWIEPAVNLLVTYGGGAHVWPLAIPANPVLAGLLVPVQGLVFDPAAPNGAASLTNAGVMRLY